MATGGWETQWLGPTLIRHRVGGSTSGTWSWIVFKRISSIVLIISTISDEGSWRARLQDRDGGVFTSRLADPRGIAYLGLAVGSNYTGDYLSLGVRKGTRPGT